MLTKSVPTRHGNPIDVQIRLRVGDTERCKEILDLYISMIQYGFAFRHEPNPDNQHHHFYLFGIRRTADTIRKTISNYLPKESFAVGETAGRKREKLNPQIAYQYGAKPTGEDNKIAEPVWMKNCDDKIEVWKTEAQAFYDQQLRYQKRWNAALMEVMVIRDTVVKVDRVWERLQEDQLLRERFTGKTVTQIKSMIATQWINNGKAMPRPSDLHRYAVSLWYMTKYPDGNIPEDAMVDEFNR